MMTTYYLKSRKKPGDSSIIILAKSSSRTQSYPVNFVFKNNRLFVYCNCPAGRFGKFCKHKIGLMQQDLGLLYDDEQIDQLNRVTAWVQKSEFLDLIFERSKFKTELREAQQGLDAVRGKMRSVEKKMAESMKKGIELQ